MKNFNPRKEINPYGYLPSRRSCKKLPKKWFNKTYYVWFKGEGEGDWGVLARELTITYYDYMDKCEWYPCPTTEELFLKLPGAKLYSMGSLGFEVQYVDDASGEFAVTKGKSPAEALCRCFNEIYKKTKGEGSV